MTPSCSGAPACSRARWRRGGREMSDPPDRTARGAPKHVYLSAAARAAVHAWADREGVSFSAALETLARLGNRVNGHGPRANRKTRLRPSSWLPGPVSGAAATRRPGDRRSAGLYQAVAPAQPAAHRPLHVGPGAV